MAFPATEQVTRQVKQLLGIFTSEHNRQELQEKLGLSDGEHVRKTYLQPSIDNGLIELTILYKPTSSKQKYTLSARGASIQSK